LHPPSNEVVGIPCAPFALGLLVTGLLAGGITTSPLTSTYPWVRSEPMSTNTARSLRKVSHGDLLSPPLYSTAWRDPLSACGLVGHFCRAKPVHFWQAAKHEWGHGSLPTPCSVTFALEAYGEDSWLLRIRREDQPNSPGDTLGIHKAIERDRRFRQVQWFPEEDWEKGAREGRARPF